MNRQPGPEPAPAPGAGGKAKRVISLVPSLTETLFDLGAGDSVVGITDFCIFPESLKLPRVGGTKNPRIEEIRALKPDLVYMNYEENLRKHADAISEFARVYVSEPKTVDDVAALITELGAMHQRSERARELVDELGREKETMPKRNFTFACAIWKKPWMWCGGDTYVSNLVECAGGVNVLQNEKRYPAVDVKDIEADVIFLPDEPYAFTAEDAREIKNAIGPFPGHLFTWHGTRTIEGLRFLRSLPPSCGSSLPAPRAAS
jgi:ABC-type Fe3+-hydroxamate transport system substrate-binding protein